MNYNDLVDMGGLLKKFGLSPDYFDNLYKAEVCELERTNYGVTPGS